MKEEEIDYNDYKKLGHLAILTPTDAALRQKILDDKGSFYFGLITPEGIKVEIKVERKNEDEE